MSHDPQGSLDQCWPELPRHGADRFGMTTPALAAPTVSLRNAEVSVIVPLYNEYENVQPLYVELTEVLAAQPRSFELILVDDGSTDGTVDRLKALAEADERLKLVLLRRNFGQTAAMSAGIEQARNDILITLDGDLQNAPEDIAKLINAKTPGIGCIAGYRIKRNDNWVRRVSSTELDWAVEPLSCCWALASN